MPTTRLLVNLLVLTLAIALSACGSNSRDNSSEIDTMPKITASDRIFSQEEFLSTGFKKSKEYDVTDLTDAVSAMYGFWNPDGTEPVDYEIRFYPSHVIAVEEGKAFADEVTGENGAVSDNDVTWKEGTRDRRTSGFTSTGGGGSLAVKYADYIIHSNVILLCQGRESIQSLERCWALINAIGITN